jgi:hypothetical protein
MPSLSRYNQINNVILQDRRYGCIPWAIEWSIRYKHLITGQWKIPVNSLNTFQQDYNLYVRTNRTIQNTFATILKEIRKNHSRTRLYHYKKFQQGGGSGKILFIEKQILRGNPCIMPLKLTPTSTHIMPIVEFDSNDFKMIWEIRQNGFQIICQVPKSYLIQIHNSNLSGRGFIVVR